MARTPSTMLQLGTQAPFFELPEPASGKTVSLNDFTGKPLLVIFTCNHCPFVLHILPELVSSIHHYQQQGIATVMINANDVDKHPDDSPDKMIELAQQQGFQFPYLYDESQQVAIDYQAACTPDLYLFDATHQLVYRGQFDSARPGNQEPVDGYDLKQAMDALLQGKAIPDNQLPSLGCNIKWKTGNEPVYYSA